MDMEPFDEEDEDGCGNLQPMAHEAWRYDPPGAARDGQNHKFARRDNNNRSTPGKPKRKSGGGSRSKPQPDLTSSEVLAPDEYGAAAALLSVSPFYKATAPPKHGGVEEEDSLKGCETHER